MEKTPQPSLGRTVIHRSQSLAMKFNGSADHPAIITRVWTGEYVNLKVLPDCGQPYDATSQCRIDPANESAQGWFWPPRV